MSAIGTASGLAIGDWSRNCARQMATRPGFAASDLDAAKRYIATLTQGRSRFSASGARSGPCFAGAHARLGGTAFEFLRYNWGAECQNSVIRPPGHAVILYFPLSGGFEARQGPREVAARPGDIIVAGSEGELHRRWSGPCELLNIVVAQEALTRILALDFAIKPDRALRFEPLALVDPERAATLFRFVETAICDLNLADSAFAEPISGRQAERTLLHIILKCILSDAAEVLDRRRTAIAPYYVRRAEEFIRKHVEEDISIEQLAGCAGVSARTLYYGFKRYRQSSPMQYIKKLRLLAARDLILDARLYGCRIGEVAARLGYGNLSQFSRDYKRQFGESPLATLNHSDGGNHPETA